MNLLMVQMSSFLNSSILRRFGVLLLSIIALTVTGLSAPVVAFAADDEKSPEFREAVQAATLEYIDATTNEGTLVFFDTIEGDFLNLKLTKLHPFLLKIADTYYVSCADFVASDGTQVGLDYLLTKSDGYWLVAQVVVRFRGVEKRTRHMENKQVLFKKS